MATQQPPRPWFRLATMMRPAAPAPAQPPPTRPAAPTTVLQPTPPLPPFRPPVALPQPSTQPPEPPPPLTPAVASPPPPPRATAPPSPVQAPAQFNLPIASPSSGSRSPVAASPAPRSPVALPTPAAPPAATTEPPPQAEPDSPGSPIISAPSIPSTRQVVSSPTFPPSPKTNANYATAAPSSPPLPTSPTPRTLLSSPAPLPPPPSPARVPAPITATVTAPPPPSPVRPASIIPSPKVVKQWDQKTPPDRSPVLKTLSYPPSPLTLPPPAQLKPDDSDYLEPIPAEAEQKTVLMQDTSNEKPKIMALSAPNNGHLYKHGEVKKDTKGILSKKTGTNSSEEQFGMRIITIAGENKGAVMDLSSPSRRKLTSTYNDNNKRGQKINGSRVMDEDARLKMKEEENRKNGMMKKQPMDAFVNSNVQGVNNSILYNCAYNNRDPGVHLSVSRNGNAGRGAHLLKDTALHH